jgi:hypothetical protein
MIFVQFCCFILDEIEKERKMDCFGKFIHIHAAEDLDEKHAELIINLQRNKKQQSTGSSENPWVRTFRIFEQSDSQARHSNNF